MMMTAGPITPATVHLVLAHIAPLEAPLPPHLVSRPLLQRHHFLGLTPDNAAEYLVWPSEEQSHVAELLQNRPVPSHDESEEHLIIQYTADTENLIAQVRITSDLRILFLWDNQHGWQYHNLATMPFPSNTYTEFSDAFAAYSPNDFLPEPTSPAAIAEDDDDSYWNAYGKGDDLDQPQVSRPAQDANANSEDAYWAQYSSVQGSGDSTLPSPRPPNKKLPSDMDTAAEPGRIFVASDDFQAHHVEPYNPLEPPAPESLARRLAALQTSGTASPTLFDESPISDSNTASPHIPEIIPVPADSSSSIYSPSQPPVDGFVVVDEPDLSMNVEDANRDVLRDNVKSLYRLWKLGRQDVPAEQDKEIFLATVRQALEQL